MFNSKYNRKSNQKKTYINEKIKAFNVLLLSDDWEKLWTFTRKEALDKAKDAWLDLVQVWYNGQDKISICKIIDYGKYQYNLKKKEKEKKNSQKSKWIKEIKISYGIGENDLEMKVKKAKKLLTTWYNVKVSLRLKWRENVFRNQARNNMNAMAEKLQDHAKSWWVKGENKWFSLTLFAKLK